MSRRLLLVPFLCTLFLQGSQAFVPQPLRGIGSSLRPQHSTCARSAGRRNLSQKSLAFKMGIKGVDSYDHSLDLSLEVEKALGEFMNHQGMKAEVNKNCRSSSCEFTGLYFQPVPYSSSSPHGMPRELEKYYRDPDYGIVNIPPQVNQDGEMKIPSPRKGLTHSSLARLYQEPNLVSNFPGNSFQVLATQVMFEARCFKPSKLCAIFKLEGVAPELRSSILKTRGPPSQEAPTTPAAAWDFGSSIGEMAFTEQEDLNDSELDQYVV